MTDTPTPDTDETTETIDPAEVLTAMVTRASALAERDDPEVLALVDDLYQLVNGVMEMVNENQEATEVIFHLATTINDVVEYANETYDIALIARLNTSLHNYGLLDPEVSVAKDPKPNRAQRRAAQRKS
jgi:hypothetical protein